MENCIINLRDIVVEYDGERVLNRLNLEIRQRNLSRSLAPQFVGKTTTLRIIGGFVEPKGKATFFDRVRINDLPPHKRQLNTVFQRYALFPHLNVYENVEFGLKLRKMPESGANSGCGRCWSWSASKGLSGAASTNFPAASSSR